MKNLFFSFCSIVFISSLAACNRDDDPKPVEEELITTLRVAITDTTAGSPMQTFTYKVDNGFGSTSQGNVQIDTLHLQASRTFNAVLTLLNEQGNPAEDITAEVLEESEEHLFLFNSNPVTGAGSVTASAGNTDNQGRPLNQTVKLTTGAAGNGALTITLLHEPTDKNATIPASAGGSTDVEAVFPVHIMP